MRKWHLDKTYFGGNKPWRLCELTIGEGYPSRCRIGRVNAALIRRYRPKSSCMKWLWDKCCHGNFPTPHSDCRWSNVTSSKFSNFSWYCWEWHERTYQFSALPLLSECFREPRPHAKVLIGSRSHAQQLHLAAVRRDAVRRLWLWIFGLDSIPTSGSTIQV